MISNLVLIFNGQEYMYFDRVEIKKLNLKTINDHDSNIYTIKFPNPINFSRIDNALLKVEIDWKLFEQNHNPGNKYFVWVSF